MSRNNPYLVAVAWPYANGDLHLGHLAGSFLPAMILSDYLRARGREMIMVSGSDMHGTPIAVKAWKEKLNPHDYASKQHKNHIDTLKKIGAHYSLYTATSSKNHEEVVQSVFTILADSGFIFKKETEQFWSEKERKFLLDRYIEGTCPNCDFAGARGDQCDNCGITLTPDQLINPYSIFGDKKLEKKNTTDYYLDLEKLQPEIEKYLDNISKDNRTHVVSTTKAWLDQGLKPRAITRDMEGYGVPLPKKYEINDSPGKVIYVWFEAVTGYLSASIAYSKLTEGFAESSTAKKLAINSNKFEEDNNIPSLVTKYKGEAEVNWEDYWFNKNTKSYYFIGKDNIPFHTVIWPGILIGLSSAIGEEFNLPNIVPANQYLNLGGAKFSKSTGNMITINNFWDNFGDTAARYFLITRMPENKDYSFTEEEFYDANNNELAANLGNLINRTLVFWNKYFTDTDNGLINLVTEVDFTESQEAKEILEEIKRAYKKIAIHIENAEFSEGLKEVMKVGTIANKYFNDQEIWALVKSEDDKDRREAAITIQILLILLENLSRLLVIFLPQLTASIRDYLKLKPLEQAIGKDNWRISVSTLVEFNKEFNELVSAARKGSKIADLKPLIKKLEQEE